MVRRLRQLAYPLAVFFGLAVFFAGLLPIIGLSPASPTVLLLPEWIRVWWQLTYTIGGLGLAVGILNQRPATEALGLALLGGAFPVQGFLALHLLGASGLPGAVFLFIISVGCWIRFDKILAVQKALRNGEVSDARRGE